MDDADRMLTTEWQNGNKRTIKLSEKANWKQQPATMRKWRAISACCRVLFSDVIMGLYTSEEVAAFAGGEFDMGDYIDGESREVPADIADLAAEVGKDREVTVTQVAERSAVTGVAERTEAGNGDWFDEALRQMEAEGAERLADEAPQGAPQGAGEPPAEPLASAQQVKLMHVLMRKVLKNGAEEKFRTWLKDTYGTETTKELTVAQASAVIDVLKKKEAALAQTAQ